MENMLVKVEQFDGNNWDTQAEMAYDGMGHRLGMTAYAGTTSVTTQYVFDYDRTLSATSDTDTTFSLYGVGGVIGELTDDWTYGLQDGSTRSDS